MSKSELLTPENGEIEVRDLDFQRSPYVSLFATLLDVFFVVYSLYCVVNVGF